MADKEQSKDENSRDSGRNPGSIASSGSRLSPVEQYSKDLEKKNTTREGEPELETDEEERVFIHAMRVLNRSKVPYLVGAAFARHVYTGIWRHTKDLDLFFKPADLRRAMDVLEDNGFVTEVEKGHWIAKARYEDFFVDMIFGAGHGHIQVDDGWFERPVQAKILGVPVRITPVEEMIAMASFVAVRNRFDGAEVAHLIHGVKGQVDWQRVLEILGEHRPLLLWQLVFFDLVYPGHADYLPQDLMVTLFEEMRRRWQDASPNEKTFRGMLIDTFSFRVDVKDWGYEDQRKLQPLVNAEGELL